MANKQIRIGATVRFLNAVGGGRVARISKDTAWVEDEDGFEIPTPLSECVLVEEGDTFMPKYKPPTLLHTKEVEYHDTPINEGRHKLRVEDFEDIDLTEEEDYSKPQRLPHTYLPAKGDFRAYLAFVPEDIQRLGQCAYDWYLINDSEYSMYYVLSLGAGTESKLHQHGVLHPKEDIHLGSVGEQALNTLECVQVHALAFAENPGIFKEQLSATLRPDLRKLLKGSSFVRNEFFNEAAYLLELSQDALQPKNESLDSTSASERLSSSLEQLERHGLGAVKREKTTQPARGTQHKVSSSDESIVVDLHIDALLDSTAGMSSADILSYQIGVFNRTMEEQLKHTGRKIVFIHGKGDGVLRAKLIAELKYRYKRCHYQDASFLQYSYGATQVTIAQS